MYNTSTKVLTIENAQLGMLNFSGLENDYNIAGNRNFCIFLDQEDADAMAQDGWNVKYTKVRKPDDVPQPFVSVNVGFGAYPPKIMLIINDVPRHIDEETVSMLDGYDYDNVDVIIRPYTYKPGKIKGYVKALYLTVTDNDFGGKYSQY